MHSERHTLIICAAAGLTEPLGRWVELLEGGWSGWEHPPRIMVTTIAGLPEAMGDRANQFAGVIGVIHDGADPSEAWKLSAQARRTNAPTVALVETVTPERSALAADGVVVLPWDEPGDRVVAAVRALRDRQGLVRRLASELAEAWTTLTPATAHDDDATRRLACVLQRSLSAHPTRMPGVEVACSVPPREGVCQWYCSTGQLDTHLVRFVLAGVDTDDARAAMTIMLLARLIEEDLRREDQVATFHPKRALTAINRLLIGTEVLPISLVYGVLDTIGGEVTMGLAGAAGAWVPGGRAPAERIEATGPRVGFDARAAFTERVLTLEPGDVLALGTARTGAEALAKLGASSHPFDPLERALEADEAGGVLLVRREPFAGQAVA
ncbi:MAG: SpoIIE family protein phosphatase [Phycisphaerales bacterium]